MTLRKQLVHAAIAAGRLRGRGRHGPGPRSEPRSALGSPRRSRSGSLVLGTILAARRRIPAMQVLARRIGVPAEGSFLRSAWAALR